MSTKSSMFATPTSNFILTFIILLVPFCSTHHILLVATHEIQVTPRPNREALGIVIGGSPAPDPSRNCPPPPPPPCPPPPSLPPSTPKPPPPKPPSPKPPPGGLSDRVAIATTVINQFLTRVQGNPCNIKSSRNFCKSSKFDCTHLNKHNQEALYGIQFNECNIQGKNITLEGFIDKLPDLSVFHANSNSFTGNIPVLSHLPYLFELDLSNNKYTGKFPVNVLGATKLTFLDLRFNNFEGPIPPEIFNLQVLVLFINNNNFEMDLPSNLGSTPAAFITLANNKFTGPIPKSIGQASKTLLEILFLNNKLSGCLPYEIGLLKEARVFDVSKNIMTGPIPRSFACLGKMEYLQLAQNEFYGPVPEEVCMLPYLRKLNLCSNYFTQVGPVCMGLVRKGILDVRDNCILGLPAQKSPEICAEFLNRPKVCEEGKMLNYVPCKKTVSSNYSDILLEGAPQPQPTLTYGALSPDFS